MIIRIAGILFVIAAGALVTSSNDRVSRKAAMLTALAAVVLHFVVRIAIPRHFVEMVVQHARWSAPIAALGVIETAGLWLPALVGRWAALPVRIAAALYIIGVAMNAAIVYYMRRVPASPIYGSALLFGFPFFLFGAVVAHAMRVRHAHDRKQQ